VIVVDSSALVAIIRWESKRDICLAALDQRRSCMSAGTLVESFITAEWKGVGPEMRRLVEALAPEIVPVTEETAHQAQLAYRQWGKGLHPAGLNFRDCFSYVVAKQRRLPLLFIGNDFSRTDIESVL
jgi:ribonuclease VapC